MTVAVFGAAGKTGRAVTAALRARGVPVRALVRRIEQARALRADGVEPVLAELPAIGAALDGVDGAYLIAPNMHPDEPGLVREVVEFAGRTPGFRLAYHSVMHPYAPAMPHHLGKAGVEAALHDSPADWTVLQPASYFENVEGVWASIRDGVWPVPYSADSRFTPVALADVAQVAARVLTEPGHSYASYELAGPDLLSTNDMAETAGSVLGIGVRTERVRPQVPPLLQLMFDYYDRSGFTGGPHVLRTLLDRPATDWASWVRARTTQP